MGSHVVIEESTEEHLAFKKWLRDYGQTLFYGLILVAALLLFLFSYTASGRVQSEVDFLKAEASYLDFRATHTADSLEELKAVMLRQPDLHQKYDPLIAQLLISIGKGSEAMPLAQKSIQKNSALTATEMRTFSRNSLLISSGDFSNLKPLDDFSKEKFPILASYSALRNALIGKKEGRDNSWEELKKELSPLFIEHLGISDQTMADFFKSTPSTL